MPPDAPHPLNDPLPSQDATAQAPDAKAEAMRFVLAQKEKQKKPHGLFARVSRRAILIALAISAMALPVQSDEMTPQPPAPAPVVQMIGQVQTVAQLEADFGRTPMGRELLQFMHSKGITIVYEPNQPTTFAAFQPDLNRIIVRPELGREEQVIYLAHELRHSWQQHELHYAGMESRQLTPEQRFTLRRFLEADARAFSSYFTADRHERLGMNDVNFGTAQKERAIVTLLRREFSSADGLTPAEYRVLGMENAFGFLSGYNPRHFGLVTSRVTRFGERVEAADNAGHGRSYRRIAENLERLRRERNNAPSAHEFEVYLRHFGGTSLDLKAPTSLQDPAVTFQILTHDYPRHVNNDRTGAGAQEIDKTLAPLTARYNAQSRRIDEMQARNNAAITQQRLYTARIIARVTSRLP